MKTSYFILTFPLFFSKDKISDVLIANYSPYSEFTCCQTYSGSFQFFGLFQASSSWQSDF